jgi:4-alpha-glucanotransferase
MQDLLGLGSQARMNTPGRASGNWRWRMAAGAAGAPLARRLREACEEAGRTGGSRR